MFYGSVWIYELSNYFLLRLGGANAVLSVQGILPTGVTAVTSASALLSLTKLTQVIVCVSIAGTLLLAIRKYHLTMTKIALITIVSVFVASFQWELLSQMDYVAVVVHEELFLLLTVIFGTLMTASFYKPLRLGLD